MHVSSHRLVFESLGEDAWRLCDQSVPATDAAHLIAYVEHRGAARYEVVWVLHARGVEVFDTLDAVLDAVAMLSPMSIPSSTKPIPIPHLPPTRLRARSV